MGLDATVMCNCIKNGLKIPQEFVDIFEVDEEGYPNLTIDYSQNEDVHHKFDSWLANSCLHEDMNFASECITNWYGLRSFQNVLHNQNTNNRFNTLLKEIPNTNDGITTPKNAKHMLKELDKFEKLNDYGKKYILVNESNGEEIWEYIPQYEGKMILSGKENIELGLDEVSFFIVNAQGKELFRSNRFKQILTNQKLTENYDYAEVKFIDFNTGNSFTCFSAISGKKIQWPDGSWQNAQGKFRFEYPEFFYTNLVDRRADEFQYIIKPLKIICSASIETGNPIRWC